MPETATDKVLDKITEICRDVKDGDQIHALWRVFNIMVGFIKGQANLINAMDVRLKQMERKQAKLEREIEEMKAKQMTRAIGYPA